MMNTIPAMKRICKRLHSEMIFLIENKRWADGFLNSNSHFPLLIVLCQKTVLIPETETPGQRSPDQGLSLWERRIILEANKSDSKRIWPSFVSQTHINVLLSLFLPCHARFSSSCQVDIILPTSIIHMMKVNIRESIDSLCRDGMDA